MAVPDLLEMLDVAVTATVLGLWVWTLKVRLASYREWSRTRLQQWQRWYREDMKKTMEMLEAQQEAQERQQAQTEALLDERST